MAAAILVAVVGLVAQARRRDRSWRRPAGRRRTCWPRRRTCWPATRTTPFPKPSGSLAAYREPPPRGKGQGPGGDPQALRGAGTVRRVAGHRAGSRARRTGRSSSSIRPSAPTASVTCTSPWLLRPRQRRRRSPARRRPTSASRAWPWPAATACARRRTPPGWPMRAAGAGCEPPALEAFRRLEAEAAAQGRSLQLVSGFRTVARQRTIFLEALAGQGRERAGRAYTAGEIAAGAADAALDATLAASAPPGFSRHHTGFALDLNDPSTGRPFTEFGESRGLPLAGCGQLPQWPSVSASFPATPRGRRPGTGPRALGVRVGRRGGAGSPAPH